jgi:hypothetical protein
MPIPDTPLFVKTHDFLLWRIRHTQRFPKHLRHSYTNKLAQTALDFQEAILAQKGVWTSRITGPDTILNPSAVFHEVR